MNCGNFGQTLATTTTKTNNCFQLKQLYHFSIYKSTQEKRQKNTIKKQKNKYTFLSFGEIIVEKITKTCDN